MENNFAGKTACSLSYPGAGVRYKRSTTGKRARRTNLRHQRERLFRLALLPVLDPLYLCVGAGNLCLHRIFFQVFVSQIMINHTFVF